MNTEQLGRRVYSSYEQRVFDDADFYARRRDNAKMGFVFGVVSYVAASVFGWNPSVPFVIAIISAGAWVGFGRQAKECQAKAEALSLTPQSVNKKAPGRSVRFSVSAKKKQNMFMKTSS